MQRPGKKGVGMIAIGNFRVDTQNESSDMLIRYNN